MMAPRSNSAKQRLREYLEAERPPAISGAVWKALLVRLAPVSESYLRDLLHQTGLPFEQPWAGIRQHTFEELEQSLGEMLSAYRAAVLGGDRVQARYCRRQAIAAKDRARFVAGNPKSSAEKKAQKEEMAAWMLIWLETPEVFPVWVAARKKALERQLGLRLNATKSESFPPVQRRASRPPAAPENHR
jgi:hypothetical protein